MYLTILKYSNKNEVKTYKLPSFAAKFTTEDFEEFISFNLNTNLSNCDWTVHEELPQMITIIGTDEI